MQMQRIEALQKMPIFGGVGSDVLEFLVDQSASVSVPKDQFFFHEGDRADSMFVLEEGEVAVLKEWAGQQYPLARLQRGDCFGEMALMAMSARSASVKAVETCKAIELSSATIYALYERDLEQFALIQMNLGREVSRRLQLADERLFRLTVGADLEEMEARRPTI